MLSSRVAARNCSSVRAPLSSARNVRALAAGKGPESAGEVQEKIPVGLSNKQAQEVKDSLTPRAEELENIIKRGGEDDPDKFFRFDGPLPEVVNGRLAMLGFTACMGAELATHATLLEQIKTNPLAIGGVAILIFFASLIPITKGTSIIDDDSGPDFKPLKFNFTNELINGRAAMLGFAIIVAFESFTGAPLFR